MAGCFERVDALLLPSGPSGRIRRTTGYAGGSLFVKKGYNRAMVKVTLKRNEGRTISAGGLWIFDNEIEKIEGEYQNGDIV